MLLGGGSSCQQCGCVGPCPQCTRTCQDPHTGDEFQVVGRGFSPEIGDEGAVSGRITDGFLTASGNFDADINGMSGGGPYYQQVGGAFFLDSVQTRFPCSLTVSFWRNTFTSSDPPASAALTDNRVRITCLAGQFAIQGGEIILNPGEYHEFVGGIPLSSTGDPRSATGTYGGFAKCDNTQVSIQARIEWNVQPRVHILLGIVRECYEEGTPCATACDGDPSPDVVYVTISNGVIPSGTYPATFPNGTYVLDRYPNFCRIYLLLLERECKEGLSLTNRLQINGNFSTNNAVLDVYHDVSKDGVCGTFLFEIFDARLEQPCGPGFVASGSATWYFVHDVGSGLGTISGTLDWEVSA